MIFVTVGQEIPFDRLIKAVDEWASSNPASSLFAQIGQTNWHPKNIEYTDFLDLDSFNKKIKESSLIIAHAGVGTIMAALKLGKPIIIMPRLIKFGEHRTEHQVSTGAYFYENYNIAIAHNERELISQLNNAESIRPGKPIKSVASESLMNAIEDFINT